MPQRKRNPAPRITCAACHRPDMAHAAYRWCGACYSRWQRAGSPPGGPPPPGTPEPIDDGAVTAAIAGARPKLTPRERHTAITELRQRGLSNTAVADHIGCSRRTVERRNAANRTGA